MTIGSPGEFRKTGYAKMTEQAPMYIYATERVGEYYSLLNISDSSVLSVIGSGDQIINAYFFGAESVVGYDLNRRAPFMFALKVAAIKALSYDEFLSFFGTEVGKGNFDKSLYKKAKPYLSSEVASFFDELYDATQNNPQESDYFHKRSYFDAVAVEINTYLKNEESFQKAKRLADSMTPEFILDDVRNLPDRLDERFDIINLSNIPNYITGERGGGYTVEELLGLLSSFADILNDGGVIFFYSYSLDRYPNDMVKEPPPASRKETLDRIRKLKQFSVERKHFPGMGTGQEDYITAMTRMS